MKKKVVALLLATVMVTSMLAGCGSKTDNIEVTESQATSTVESTEETEAEETLTFPLEETMTFSMLIGFTSAEDTAYGEGSAFDLLAKEANIEFDIQEVLHSDITEKRGLIMGSDDYPDALFKSNMWDKAEIQKYGEQGILIPLEDLIREYAPNLTKILDERELWPLITSADGHVYSLPEIDSPQPATGWLGMINQKWLDNLGLDMPTDNESFYNVLRAFAAEDANGNGDPDDEIPILFDTWLGPHYMFSYLFDRFDISSWSYITEDGQVDYIPTSDAFKEYLAEMAKLYEEGAIYETSFTQSVEQRIATTVSGDVAGAFLGVPNGMVPEENVYDYTFIPAFGDETWPVSQGVTVGTFAITDKCENPEVLIKWMDQWYTEEGGIYAWMGIEDVNYTVNEDGTWTKSEDTTVPKTIQGVMQHPSVQPEWYFVGSTNEWTKKEYEWKKEITDNGWNSPVWQFTAEQYEEVSTAATDCWNYWVPYQAEVITGVVDLESTWDEYVATMNELGAETIERIYNEMYSTMQ